MTKVYASILAADFLNLESELKRVELGHPDRFHFDIMDGHFVPNITFGPSLVAQVAKIVSTPMNVHLLVTNPEHWIDQLANTGVESISIHYEATPWVLVQIEQIRKHNIRPGIALNAGTSVEVLEHVLPYIDFVILMTVASGFGGQTLMADTLIKISKAHDLKERINPKVEIAVDGGVNKATRDSVVQAGADILIAGTAIFKSENPGSEIKYLRGYDLIDNEQGRIK